MRNDEKLPTNDLSKPQTEEEVKSRTEQVIDRIKKYPMITILSAIAALIIVISGVTGGLATIPGNLTQIWHYIHPIATSPIVIATHTPPGNTCGNTTAQTLCIYSNHKGPVYTVAWSPDGTRIASGGKDGTVQVWNATTGSNILTYRGHKGAVNALAWSPDGQRIASGGNDGTIQVWLSGTGKLVYSPVKNFDLQGNISKTSPVTALVWSPDGGTIAVARQDGSVNIFAADLGVGGADTGPPIVINCSTNTNIDNSGFGQVDAIAWSSDSKFIAVACTPNGLPLYDNPNNIVGIWNLSNDPPTNSGIYHPNRDSVAVSSLAWSPNGQFIATSEPAVDGNYGRLKVWNVSQPNGSSSIEVPIYFSHTFVSAIAWSPNSKCLALGSGTSGYVEVWSLDAQKRIDLYTGQVGNITAVTWSPDGQRIASASDDGTVNVWKVSQGGSCSV